MQSNLPSVVPPRLPRRVRTPADQAMTVTESCSILRLKSQTSYTQSSKRKFEMSNQLNKYSSRITQPPSQGASQAMLYATGLREEDMNKAQVGIASVWYEGNPCNMHLLMLAEKAKEG